MLLPGVFIEEWRLTGKLVSSMVLKNNYFFSRQTVWRCMSTTFDCLIRHTTLASFPYIKWPTSDSERGEPCPVWPMSIAVSAMWPLGRSRSFTTTMHPQACPNTYSYHCCSSPSLCVSAVCSVQHAAVRFSHLHLRFPD